MGIKLNCWQVKKCGRQFGGAKLKELGVCLAAKETDHHGINGGTSAGRYCWKVAGTLCGGKVQGTYAQKLANCNACNFYKRVQEEEGASFVE